MKGKISFFLIIVFGIIFLIEFCLSFSSYDCQKLENPNKGIIKSKARLSGVEQLVENKDMIFGVNKYQEILLYNKRGQYLGYLEIPFSNKNDIYELYIYNNILCARRCGRGNEQGDILMFRECNYFGMIDFKNEGEMVTKYIVKDAENKEIISGKTIDEQVLVFSDGKLYYDFDQMQVNNQITQRTIKISDSEEIKVKGIWKKKLLKVSGNKHIIIYKESWKEFLQQNDIVAGISFWMIWINIIIYKTMKIRRFKIQKKC